MADVLCVILSRYIASGAAWLRSLFIMEYVEMISIDCLRLFLVSHCRPTHSMEYVEMIFIDYLSVFFVVHFLQTCRLTQNLQGLLFV